jgi:hypothetical protein
MFQYFTVGFAVGIDFRRRGWTSLPSIVFDKEQIERHNSPHPWFQNPVPYSNRRISTGNNRAASRAGNSVATMAMLIAATAIHRPSKKFGWKGT